MPISVAWQAEEKLGEKLNKNNKKEEVDRAIADSHGF